MWSHGQFNRMNYIIGTNGNEGTDFVPKDLTPDGYKELIQTQFAAAADKILAE